MKQLVNNIEYQREVFCMLFMRYRNEYRRILWLN